MTLLQDTKPYTLGLDIGVNSVGWALVTANDGTPYSILKAGVRIFPEGVEKGIERGMEKPKNAKRRDFRQRTKQLRRRAKRHIETALALQRAGLLPLGNISTSSARQTFFQGLDSRLFTDQDRKIYPHQLLYRLRARALDEKLLPEAVGRALHHLAQRRGFLSNRRTEKKKEDSGIVHEAINDLAQKMAGAKARTLGEYFSKLDPEEERIRSRWTARGMFQHEFDAIWSAQSAHHPVLMTDQAKKDVYRTIFDQRRLKKQKHLIGECSLEKGHIRAPVALLISQRFRMLQKINDLEASSKISGEIFDLTEKRSVLIDLLEKQGDMTFDKVKKALGLGTDAKLNFEKEDEKNEKLPGNRTSAKLRKVFGERWDELSEEEKNLVVNDVLCFRRDDKLAERGERRWGLAPEAAKQFARVRLEPGRLALSQRAMQKLLPEMEKGVSYATVKKKLWPGLERAPILPELPSMQKAIGERLVPELRNPAVARVLNEVRKVVNAVVRRFGKPSEVRIELARDLKKTRKDRKEIWRKNQENEKARRNAAKKITDGTGIQNPSRADIEKWLLAEECNWVCPYTGDKQFGVAELLGTTPQYDVEHIIPFSRCLDDSFNNKTICQIHENREIKRNRTPWEAYAGTDRWEGILARVGNFKGPSKHIKMRRFMLRDAAEVNEEFTQRHLNDTRYASRLAVRYLGLLFGADHTGVDGSGRRVVSAGRGQITKFVRDELRLNKILNDGGEKSRDDHRHHAVDALAVALTDAAMVKRLSDAASRAPGERRRRFGKMALPWPTFAEDAYKEIRSLIPSHRSQRKVNGALHEETNYSAQAADGAVHVRKRVEDLSEREVDAIVDKVVRERVKLALGSGKPKDVFKDPTKRPFLQAKDGRNIPIKSVRIRKLETVQKIGQGPTERYVMTGGNHHVEILETRDKQGRAAWNGEIVSRLEAMARLRRHEPIVRRDHGPNKKFMFSLCGGDTVRLTEDGKEELYIVRTVSHMRQGKRNYVNLAFIRAADARLKNDVLTDGGWKTSLVGRLKEKKCEKVIVTPLGEIFPAND